MGDCLRAGQLSYYVTSHPGPLSLAIPCVGAMSTGDGYGQRYREENGERVLRSSSPCDQHWLKALAVKLSRPSA